MLPLIWINGLIMPFLGLTYLFYINCSIGLHPQKQTKKKTQNYSPKTKKHTLTQSKANKNNKVQNKEYDQLMLQALIPYKPMKPLGRGTKTQNCTHTHTHTLTKNLKIAHTISQKHQYCIHTLIKNPQNCTHTLIKKQKKQRQQQQKQCFNKSSVRYPRQRNVC